MKQYIDKSAIVAEIEKRIAEGEKVVKEFPSSAIMGLVQAYKNTLSFIDTLEVKEVDINKEISQFIDANFEKATIGHKISLRRVAKHFYELGLKTKK